MQELHQLAVDVGVALQKRKWLLTTAESCTGGLVAYAITSIPKSSGWFERGFVTYSNDAKQELLSIRREDLEEHGAVSKFTACAMVQGALAKSHAQIAVAVTGVAGPDGGTKTTPVGTVWIAWATHHNVVAECFFFNGDRREICIQASQEVLKGIIKIANQ